LCHIGALALLGLLEVLCHLIFTVFPGQLDQRFPTRVISRLGCEQRIERLGNRAARVGNHVHTERLRGGIGTQLVHRPLEQLEVPRLVVSMPAQVHQGQFSRASRLPVAFMSRPVYPPRAPLRALAGPLLLGIGLGGLFDGIVFHQLLQWHNMVSTVLPPTDAAALRLNVLADGLFHAGAYLVTLLGIFVLWSRTRRRLQLPSTREFIGTLLFGWGLFNSVEGIVNHHVLKLHNVREVADPMPWNIGFLVIGGAGLMLLGAWVIRGRLSS